MTVDLAIVIVSTNEARWLRPCLSTVFAHAGELTLDVVVVDNESTDGTWELVVRGFPAARVVSCANHGFGHANNRGAVTCDARYVLFLNPDTEIVDGTFEDLVAKLDARPTVGLAGVKQLTAAGELWPTIRYFPNSLRAACEALCSARWPVRPRWSSELERDLERYEREYTCDWTSGSFMLCRREALLSGGLMDERFFIYSEEPDLSLRMKRAGWETRHLPSMTIIHHAGKGGVRPRMVAQDAYTRMQYARKHFPPASRAAYLCAVGVRHALRLLTPGRLPDAQGRRAAARLALATMAGRAEPPFGAPPATALAPGAATAAPAKPGGAMRSAPDIVPAAAPAPAPRTTAKLTGMTPTASCKVPARSR